MAPGWRVNEGMNPRFLLALTLFLHPACSSGPRDATGTDAGGDAAGDAHSTPDTQGPGDSAASDAAADAPPVCNTLVNSGATVTVDQVASDPPAPQGGTLLDGRYTLTTAVIYTGASGPTGSTGTAQMTLQVMGNTVQVAGTGQPATRTVTITTSGTSIDSVDTCPDTDTRSDTYTATPTTFTIQLDGGTDDAGARTVVETFTKQ
jgi:hypothetical protein